MDYVGNIFRPPSEARSLLLQVTVGCSWNRCTFCAMYRDPEQRFRVKPWETVAAAAHLREAGIRHSVIVMLGIGGVERSREHAEATADLLTDIDPPYVGALTTTLVPGTPLHPAAARGEFELPDPWGMLAELEILVDRSRPTR